MSALRLVFVYALLCVIFAVIAQPIDIASVVSKSGDYHYPAVKVEQLGKHTLPSRRYAE